LLSCSGGDGGSPDARQIDFDRAGLVDNIATNVIVPTYSQFLSDVDDLDAGIAAWCASLGGVDEDAMRTAAQVDYTAAMDTWQLAELMLIGPAHADGDALRDFIYSWEIVSACAVDQDVKLLLDDGAGYDISTRLTNRRGLDALEYILYTTDLASVCPPQAQPEGWDALADDAKKAARCAFAEVAVADVRTNAQSLVDAWAASGDDFHGELTMPGAGRTFETIHQSVDAVFAALFYIDLETKDAKLAEPVGLLPTSCDTQDVPCAAEIESQYGRRSIGNISANLEGLDMMFAGRSADGTDGLGFDDFLRAADRDDLADKVAADIGTARTLIDGIGGTLHDALVDDVQGVVDSHAAVREVTNSLKGDVPSTLGLTVPAEAGGDAD
jgi:predicted lipoprotein